jgi:replicative DNA helicase
VRLQWCTCLCLSDLHRLGFAVPASQGRAVCAGVIMSQSAPDDMASMPAEQALLGCLLIEVTALDAVAGLVDEADFFPRNHRAIFRAISKLASKGEPVDVVTVGEYMEAHNLLDEVGGLAYLAGIAQDTPSAANVRTYAAKVREYAILRRVATAAMEIADLVRHRGGRTATEVLDLAQSKIMAVAETATGKSAEFARMQDMVPAALHHIDDMARRADQSEVTGLATGFTDLDRITTGLHPGDLAILAARPSMGKTALALNIAEHVAHKGGKPVALFSLEMTSGQLIFRLLSGVARLNQHRLKIGRLNDDEWRRLMMAGEVATDLPIFVNESGDLTVNELRASARRLHRETGGLGLIVIDYIQLMRGDGRSDNRAAEVAEISRAIKSLAKELQVPIIALSQLNRGLEARPNKRPIMSDLRDSGGIEQDADLILMLYRDEYYNESSLDAGIAELIVGKQRNGPTGTLYLNFVQALTRFENRAHGPIPSLQEKNQRRAARAAAPTLSNAKGGRGSACMESDDE